MASFDTIRHAPIEATSGGADNTIVAAVAGKRIRVLAYMVVVEGTAGIRWKSGAGTNLSGAMPFPDGGGAAASVSVGEGAPGFLLQTNVGEALVLNCGAATTAFGHVTYQEVA